MSYSINPRAGAVGGGTAAQPQQLARAAAEERQQELPAEKSRSVPRRPEFALVGVSDREVCGVRDHGGLLADALRSEGASCLTYWLTRSASGWRAEREELRRWLASVSQDLDEHPPEAIVLQYSVFAYSHRGMPAHVRAVRAALTRAQVPLIVIGHEFAFPFGRNGLRGWAWAAAQRLALRGLARDSAALIPTTDARARWLATRAWLPKRPMAVAPVFSNLPPPRERPDDPSRAEKLGLFSYSYGDAAVSMTLDALAQLRESRPDLTLELLGAPGSESAAGHRWCELARARGLEHAIEFSGTLPPQEVSDAIAACDVLLFIDPAGPTSRKGSLAGMLASGRPVVAIDGQQRWEELSAANAIRIAAPSAVAVAAEVRALLEDAHERAALGSRARDFHDRRMAAAVSARAVLQLFELVSARGGGSSRAV